MPWSKLYLNVLRGADGGTISFPEFRRYCLPAKREAATYERLSDEPIELPRINAGKVDGRAYNTPMVPATAETNPAIF